MAWKDLSLREKAAYIHTGVRNGLYRVEDIEDAYNKFAEGGHLFAGDGDTPNILTTIGDKAGSLFNQLDEAAPIYDITKVNFWE